MSEGTKYDTGKAQMDLVDPRVVEGLARVLGMGAEKYDPYNWYKGLAWSRVYAACLRHLFAFWLGEDQDQESGLLHIDHAICNLMFLRRYLVDSVGVDDRPPYK